MADAEAEVEGAQPPVSAWKLGVTGMMLGIAGFILLILLRMLLPANWEFSIEATTDIVELQLPPGVQTQWQVDGALICSRQALDMDAAYRLDSAREPCGSAAWSAWRVPGPEQVVTVEGGTRVVVQWQPDGSLAMSLRAPADANAGRYSVVGVVEDVALGRTVNLIWSTVPARALTLPFSGATTLGRAVGWSSVGMLRSGSIVVYTADESADKRTRVEETTLMLGDQIQLDEPGRGEPWPKGFVRVEANADAMQIVAFGRANSLRIDRFGESGYDFRPGVLRSLAADPLIAFWGSILAAYMTLILSLQPFVGADDKGDVPVATDWLKRFNAWLRRKP